MQQKPPFISSAENLVLRREPVPRHPCTNRTQSKSTNSGQQKNQIVPLAFVSAAAIGQTGVLHPC
jgi:hypothetical protein